MKQAADISAVGSLDGADIADAFRRQGPAAVRGVLGSTRPAIDAIIDGRLASWPDRAENAEVAVACVRSLARLLGELKPNDVARQASRLGEQVQLPCTLITRELSEAVSSE